MEVQTPAAGKLVGSLIGLPRERGASPYRARAALLCGIALAVALAFTLSGSTLAVASPPIHSSPITHAPPPTRAEPLPNYPVRITRDMAYGPRPQERLDLCRPTGVRGPLPVILAIHGGAWVGGDKAGWIWRCRFFAALGFAAAVIDYRLAPHAVWPAQLEDAQLAVRYLRANAGPLDLNPRAVCALGESAGAHLALFLGSVAGNVPGDAAALYPDKSPQVQCVIDEYGPADLMRPMPLLDNGAFLALFGGSTRASDPAVYQAASPIFAVSAHSAPTLIVQGNADTTVPPEQSRLMAAALRRVGVAVTAVSYAGGHSFGGLDSAGRAAILRTEAFWLLRWYQHFR